MTLSDLIDRLGVRPSKGGGGWEGYCPIHREERRFLMVIHYGDEIGWLTGRGCAGEDVLDFLGVPGEVEIDVEPPEAETPAPPKVKTPKGSSNTKEDPGAVLVRFILARYDLVKKRGEGTLYAVPKEGAKIAEPLVGDTFQAVIYDRFLEETNRTPSDGAWNAAMRVLVAKGLRAPETEIALRSWASPDLREVWVDLAIPSEERSFVRVTAEGCSLQAAPERPIFARSNVTAPLPVPECGGDLEDLRDFLSFEPGSVEWRASVGWLVVAFFHRINRPILWFTGDPGSAKTSRGKVILSLIDPVEDLGIPATSQKDDVASQIARYVPSYDNVSEDVVPKGWSDALCRLVTGRTVDARLLYSNGTLWSVSLRRTAFVSSLSIPLSLKDDALDRIVRVRIPELTARQRKGDERVARTAEAKRPLWLGAVLDAVAAAIREYREISGEEAEALPFDPSRFMAYAGLLLGLDRAHGLDVREGYFAAFAGEKASDSRKRALDDPAISALAILASPGLYVATPTTLLRRLTLLVGDGPVPKQAQLLEGFFTRRAPSLAALGLKATRKASKGYVRWEIAFEPTDGVEDLGIIAERLTEADGVVEIDHRRVNEWLREDARKAITRLKGKGLKVPEVLRRVAEEGPSSTTPPRPEADPFTTQNGPSTTQNPRRVAEEGPRVAEGRGGTRRKPDDPLSEDREEESNKSPEDEARDSSTRPPRPSTTLHDPNGSRVAEAASLSDLDLPPANPDHLARLGRSVA